jgi:hypothetical protein
MKALRAQFKEAVEAMKPAPGGDGEAKMEKK